MKTFCTALILFLLFSTNSILPFVFTFEPIDAVIPCHKKDLGTINLVIEGLRKNVKNLRRIIVVSATKLTDKAEWFDERNYPFTQKTIALEIFRDRRKAKEFMNHPKTRIGWIFQQFLKSYAIFVIPNISSNVLIVDADTIFLRPVTFQDPQTAAGLYNPATENYKFYFDHLERVLPGFKKVFPQHSGIAHHMLLQRSVMDELYTEIRKAHNQEPWKVFCEKVDHEELFRSCMCIEYELYFNFVFSRSNLVKIRCFKWHNVPFHRYQKDPKSYAINFDYVSCHSWMN